MSESWIVAQIKPNAVRLAEANVRRQSFDFFAPMSIRTIRRNGRFIDVRQLLFSGYAFISVSDLVKDAAKINNTRGVLRVVFNSQHRAGVLPAGFVAALRAGCDANDVFQSDQSHRPGDRVEVMHGPFASTLATIHSLDGNGRLSLLLDLLGQETRVQLDQSQIQSV